MDFIKTKTSVKISELFNKAHTENTLSASDCKDLIIKNNNCVILRNLTNKIILGKEIGSEQYLPKSDHRFLKTTNINRNFQIDEKNIEYCTPNFKANPKKNNILIVKDGGGDGLGEVSIYPYDNKNNKDSISAGIIAIELKENIRNYVFGVLKSNFFKNYIDLNTPQGSTIRHSKMVALDFNVPFPTDKNNEKPKLVEDFVSVLVQNIIDKENEIGVKNNEIDKLIQKELEVKNSKNQLEYRYPKISELKKETRLDSLIYKKETKEILNLIKNYKLGYKTFSERGYKTKRGQNLAISVVGESFYAQEYKKNFYQLVTSTNLTEFRTLDTIRFLGNKNNLIEINKGDILLSATGNVDTSIGKTFVFCEKENKMCSNFNSFFLYKENYNIEENVFISLILSWFKNVGFYKNLVGRANGGSLTESHFDKLLIPNFEPDMVSLLSQKYFNEIPKFKNLELHSYLKNEIERNKKIGIYQLNIELFQLKEKLNETIRKIVMNEHIDVNLNY